mgnify:CR=1 FL=1|jgi:hypothetical protein
MMVPGGASAAAGQREAISWAKRYGKNCMDARRQGDGSALRQTTNRQRTATVEPVQLPATVRPGRPGKLQQRSSAATKRVSLAGLAKLEERERRLSRVSFCDDADKPRPRPSRKQRPASATVRHQGLDVAGTKQLRPARPASAPSARRWVSAAAETGGVWPALDSTLEDVDGNECMSVLQPEPEREPEPKAGLKTQPEAVSELQPQTGSRPTSGLASPQQRFEIDNLVAQLHRALDRAQGREWGHRKLVCGAVLDAVADCDASTAALLRRVGSEMSGGIEPSHPEGESSSKLSSADGKSSCQHCDAAKQLAAQTEVKAARERATRAEAAAAHLQRQVSLERSRTRDASKRAEELEAENHRLRTGQGPGQAPDGLVALRASSEYSWDGHSEQTTSSEESDDEKVGAAMLGLSSTFGRPPMGSAALAMEPVVLAADAVTDYAPPIRCGGASHLPTRAGGITPMSLTL